MGQDLAGTYSGSIWQQLLAQGQVKAYLVQSLLESQEQSDWLLALAFHTDCQNTGRPVVNKFKI